MKTTIYNTTTEEAGVISPEPYMVDGKPGILPDNLIELPVIETQRPQITETQKLKSSWVADLENMEYRHEWQVIDLTNEEIQSKRQSRYQSESDSHYLAMQKYTELEQFEKAQEAKKKWFETISLIDSELPYNI